MTDTMTPRTGIDGPAPTIVHVTTVSMSLTFLRGQVGYMKSRGFAVHAITSPGEEVESFAADEEIPVHSIRMTRRITPLRDLGALVRMRRVLAEIRPSIVHSHTPKGGLLGMLAATIRRVPVRVYHMRGLPFVTARGLKRRLLIGSEKIACALAHRVICNSHSMRRIAIEEGLCHAGKIEVPESGSGNGVDATGRFDPDRIPATAGREVREELGIPPGSEVVGFVGRLVREKGIVELEEAWRRLRSDHPRAHLLLVGPFETQDPLPGRAVERLQDDPRVHLMGLDWDTPRLYAAMDLVVLPTYREGFPNVPLEAAAMRLPVVATRIPGCVDAVVDGVTGTLVPARDAEALEAAIRTYLEDPDLRRRHGEAGRERVLAEFLPEAIWAAVHAVYADLLEVRGDGTLRAGRGGMSASVKRAMDVVGALGGMVVLSPVMAVVALLVRLRLGSPVLFRQERPGLHGEPFVLYKFRTMKEERDANGLPLPDAERLTGFGKVLRATSLDELPELWNVLKGEMSLVGPRPLLMEYLDRYTPEQARRHEVRPGITGLAQVQGRNATTWERRLALDTWYVDNRTFWLDLRILFLTLRKVVAREGISQDGTATMKRFRGANG